MKDKIIVAFDRGYRVKNDGTLCNSKDIKVKGYLSPKGYYTFGLYIKPRNMTIFVHRLQAFQKFGHKIFDEGMVVRHLDGNKQNNSFSNIEIGTISQNYHDIPIEKINAMRALVSKMKSKFPVEVLRKIASDRKDGMRYVDLSRKYEISTPSLIYYLGKAKKKPFVKVYEDDEND